MIIGQRWTKIAYIDCFAGPWKSSAADLSDTSPGIAIRLMSNCREQLQEKFRRNVRIRSVFVESDVGRATLLEAHVAQLSPRTPRPEIWRKQFDEAIPEVLQWLEPDEFAFVFIDPFGWKGVVEPDVLAPFLRRPSTELLINFMWNFINLATGLPEQERNLTGIFGADWRQAIAGDGERKRRELMRLYRQKLAEVSRLQGRTRLRTAMLPVEYIDKKKIIFNLVYATHSPTGLVVFWEEAEKTARHQQRLKLQHALDRHAAKGGQVDLFNADAHAGERSTSLEDLQAAWLAYLPRIGGTLIVDVDVIATLIETTDGLISDLQIALRELIKCGVIDNESSKRPRPVNAVIYKKKEVLRRMR